MKSYRSLIAVLFLLSCCFSSLVAAKDKRDWKTGTLVSITDSQVSHVVADPTGDGVRQQVVETEYRISVLLDGVTYVGSYKPLELGFGKSTYRPTDLKVDSPIQVSVQGEDMYLKRPNGKDFKTTIIRRTRKTS